MQLWRCCGGVVVVVLLWWCCCGGVVVVVLLWWCCCGGGVLCGGFVMVLLDLKLSRLIPL